MKKYLLLTLVLVAGFLVKAEIITPYPESIVLNQIDGAEKERLRLRQGHKKYDKQATGFYIAKGDLIEVEVEILNPASSGEKPTLTVGTLGFNAGGRSTGQNYVLNEGKTRITTHPGGLIWLSFTENKETEPTGIVRVTFTEESKHVRAPHYVYGVTNDKEFAEMYQNYQTPDVIYTSDFIAVAATRESALQYSFYNRGTGTVLKEWMEAIHILLEKEDDISGLDNMDPNPLHHRLKAGEIRYLLVENTYSNPHASPNGYTGYPYGSRHRYLTKIGVEGNNSWMLGHELGHQHQQPAYQIEKATESTVNIYSYVVERHFFGEGYNRTSVERWQQAQNTYLSLPVSKRIYQMNDDDLRDIIGFNYDELRFMPWEQMFLMFGDQFYKTLHRVTREEKMMGGTHEERRVYLIWKASQISGYDLTDFFNHWGIRVTSSANKKLLRARIANALNTGVIEPLPRPAEDYVMNVTGQNMPPWAHLSLKGITSSGPELEVFDRGNWTVTTSIEGAYDGTVGGINPEYMIDGQNTCFVFVKPGEELGGVVAPADYIPSFIVDMKAEKAFNSVIYKHRSGNTSTYLRARQLSILGSNDNENFSPIVPNYSVDFAKNETELRIKFAPQSYRYVKVIIEDWDKNNGKSIQIEEFSVGYDRTESLPEPDPIQFKVNVDLDQGITSDQVGLNMIDEDSMFTLQYTLGAGVTEQDIELYVDGDRKIASKGASNYFYTFKVTNHAAVKIVNKTASGLIKSAVSQLVAYPNPVKAGQSFVVQFDYINQPETISVFNLSGSKLQEETIDKPQYQGSIDNPGIYILKAKIQDKVSVVKLIVE